MQDKPRRGGQRRRRQITVFVLNVHIRVDRASRKQTSASLPSAFHDKTHSDAALTSHLCQCNDRTITENQPTTNYNCLLFAVNLPSQAVVDRFFLRTNDNPERQTVEQTLQKRQADWPRPYTICVEQHRSHSRAAHTTCRHTDGNTVTHPSDFVHTRLASLWRDKNRRISLNTKIMQ